MPKTVYELFQEPEFLAGSHGKRQAMFDNWKATEVQPYIDNLPDVQDRLRIVREVDEVFNTTVEAPVRPDSDIFGEGGFTADARTAISASADQLQVMGGEVAAQLNEVDRDRAQRQPVNPFPGPPLPERTEDETSSLLAAIDERGESIQAYIDENVAEGEEERQQYSEYTRDKQLELQELMDAAPTDGAKALAAMDFYLTSGNLDMLGLLTLESAAPTAAAIGATVGGGLVAGPLGAGVTASVVEGAMGAGEASLGAYQTALAELKKQGVPEAEAKKQAREASRTAALIGGVGSAILGPAGEALPVIRSFGRRGTTPQTRDVAITDNSRTELLIGGDQRSRTRKIAGGAGVIAGGVLGEFAQGATVQVAENIAVDPITPTGMFEGAITAGTLEALAAAPTVAATQAIALSIPDAVDAADEIMQSTVTSDQLEDALSEAQDQDTRIPTVEVDTPAPVDTGATDSPGSSIPTTPADSPSQPTPPVDTGAVTGDTGSAETTPPEVPVPEQPASPDTPDVTIPTPEAPATPAVTGNGADVPTVPATDTGGDGVSSTPVTGGDGVTGQSGGDLSPEVVVDAEGFDTGTTYYHGTYAEITDFGSSAQSAGLMFFTEDPAYASQYATGGGSGYTRIAYAEDLAGIEVTSDMHPGVLNPDLTFATDDEAKLSAFFEDLDVRGLDATAATDLQQAMADYQELVDEAQTGGNVIPVHIKKGNVYGTKEDPIHWRELEKKGGAKWLTDNGYDSAVIFENGSSSTLAIVRPEQVRSIFQPEATPPADQEIAELEDFAPPDLTPEQEWGEYELEVPFKDLDTSLQQIWKDQLVNWNEDPTFSLQAEADKLMATHRKNTKRAPVKITRIKRRSIPDGVGEYMETGTTEDAAARDYIRTEPLPIVLTNTTPKAPLPQGIQITQGAEVPGVAGVLNAAVKRSGAERGTYLIAEPAAGVAHVMSHKGILIRTVPYKATGETGTVSTVNGPMGTVAYERVQVKKPNAKVTKRSDGVAEYEGMAIPSELESVLKPKGAAFSGSVYVIRPEATVQNPATPVTVSAVTSPLPKGVADFIVNNSDATQHVPVQDVIDTVLADPDIVNWPQYAHQLRQLRPHVADYNLGHDVILANNTGVMGYHAGDDRQIMLKDGDGFSYHTFTHEIAHAATVETFKKRSARTDPIWQQLEALFELVAKLPNFNAYGMTNPKEFVAEIYTNENFRAALDGVQGIKQDKTLWDQIRDLITGNLFAVDQFDSRQLVDWTEALFETNEQLIHDEVTPLSERGRTSADVIEDRHSDDYSITWTRRGLARLALLQKLKVRKALLDKDTPLLKFLALETWLPRTNADYDTYKSWTLFNTAGNVKKQIIRQFTANHIRRINTAHSNLYQSVKGSGLSASHVRDIAAHYAMWAHIPNATDVQEASLQASIDEAQVAVDDIEARQAAGELVPDSEEETALKVLRKAEFQLLKFTEVQAGIIQNINNQDTALMALAKDNPYTVMGGATKIQAYRLMDAAVDKLTPPNGDKAETKAVLEDLRWLYVEANRGIWQRLIAEGEVSQEQAAAHAASGLDKDYIPLTGATEILDSDSDNYRAFGTSGAMQAPVEGRRNGRLSKPENADFSLQRKLDNMASRVSTRPFRQQLLADIQSGNIPPAKAQWTLLKGKAQYQPKAPPGIRPLHLRTEDGTYQFWLRSEFDKKDATVMDAINGIGGADTLLTDGGIAGTLLRGTGKTTRAFALAYTHATATFAPINFMREGQESLTNITARDLSWTDENGVEQTVDRVQLTAQVSKGAFDPKFFQDTWRVYRNRAFSSTAITYEDRLVQSRLGKKFLEAEAAGAINIEIDAQLAMFQAQDMSSKDKRAIQQITRYAGEVEAAAMKEGKLSTATVKALMQEVNARNKQGFEYLFAALQLWNRLFDVRIKVAIYDALTAQGMPKELAAARVLDLANYNKEGDVGKFLSAISPFWRSKVFGAANTLRTAGAGVAGIGALTGATISPTFRSTFFSPDNKIKRKQKTAPIVGLMVQASILYAIGSVLRLLAGDDEEDPDFKYNKLDAVQPFTNRGNLSIALGAKDGYAQQYANVPIGYGMTRILHVTAQQLLRKGNDSPLATNSEGMNEVYKTIMDEVLPTPIAVSGDEAKNIMQWMMLSFTPEMLQPAARTGMNIGAFGNTLDFAASGSDDGAGQGYFRTPEAWVSAADMMNDTIGTNWTPQQARGYLMTLFPGPLAAIPDSITAGDRAAKGLPETNRDELGLYNILGLSRLYGRATPPEINAGYTLAAEFEKERLAYAEQQEAVKPRKLTRGRPTRPRRGASTKVDIGKVWVWDEDKLAKDNKLYLLDQQELYEDFDKARKALKRELNQKDKEIRQKEDKVRKASGNEAWAWAVSQEAYNEDREFWDTKYLEERELFKNFILNFTAVQRARQ